MPLTSYAEPPSPEEKQHSTECGSPEISATDLYGGEYNDLVYHAKACVLNRAIQEIGMGKYQWCLFVAVGMGRFIDGFWNISSALILAPLVYEFRFNPPFLPLAFTIGLFVGSLFWSFGCDIWGRRWSFDLSLLIAGIFGLSAAGSPNFVTLAALIAVVAVSVGGNFTVDLVTFLDLVPRSHQYLLTTLAIWWSLGQLTCCLIAWPLISNFSCVTPEHCEKSSNMGWRYLLFSLGGLTFSLLGLRFLVFTLLESPRFLSGVGRNKDAVDIIHRLAKYNGKTCTLTVGDLEAAEHYRDGSSSTAQPKPPKYDSRHFKPLFATPKMALSTSLLIFIWGLIGLGTTLYTSFLPYLLVTRGASFGDGSLYVTYRNQTILLLIGAVSCLFAGRAVDVPYIGRRGTAAISSVLTGAFLYASTTSRTSNELLGWSCGFSFFTYVTHGVLAALSAEVFPAKDRGTGSGLVSGSSRIAGVMAPVIALYANLATAVPVYISGGMFVFAGFLALFLPYEPQGKASI